MKKSFQWQRGKLIGKGRFGSVYTGINLDNGNVIAVKQISLLNKANAETEIDILSKLRNNSHPNVIQLVDSEATGEYFNIFLEYCPIGSIHSLLKTHYENGLPELTAKCYIEQLLKALDFIHQRNVAHRDLKCENLLLSSDGVLKLADFGSAKLISSTHDSLQTAREGVGSPFWMSPEVVRVDDTCRDIWRKADVWGVGCVLIELLTGSPPWANYSNPMSIMYKIATETPEIPFNVVSSQGQDFLQACFTRDADSRPSASDLLSHPFITEEVYDDNSVNPVTDYNTPAELWTSKYSSATIAIARKWYAQGNRRPSWPIYPLVVSVAPYEALDDTELTIEFENTVLEVIEERYDGWWYVRSFYNPSISGWFPSTYVEPVRKVSVTTTSCETYDDNDDSILELYKGQEIDVLLEEDNYTWWLYGRDSNTGYCGWFQSSMTTVEDDDEMDEEEQVYVVTEKDDLL